MKRLREPTDKKRSESVPFLRSGRSMMVVTRAEPRLHTILRKGRIFDDRLHLLTDCVVLDISKHGARLKIKSIASIPPKLIFFDERTGRMFISELRWHRNDQIGLFIREGTD